MSLPREQLLCDRILDVIRKTPGEMGISTIQQKAADTSREMIRATVAQLVTDRRGVVRVRRGVYRFDTSAVSDQPRRPRGRPMAGTTKLMDDAINRTLSRRGHVRASELVDVVLASVAEIVDRSTVTNRLAVLAKSGVLTATDGGSRSGRVYGIPSRTILDT